MKIFAPITRIIKYHWRKRDELFSLLFWNAVVIQFSWLSDVIAPKTIRKSFWVVIRVSNWMEMTGYRDDFLFSAHFQVGSRSFPECRLTLVIWISTEAEPELDEQIILWIGGNITKQLMADIIFSHSKERSFLVIVYVVLKDKIPNCEGTQRHDGRMGVRPFWN